MKYTIKEFAKEIRKKYPNAYDDLSDEELVSLWIKKFPEEKSKIDFNNTQKKESKGFFSTIWWAIKFSLVIIGIIFLVTIGAKIYGDSNFQTNSTTTDQTLSESPIIEPNDTESFPITQEARDILAESNIVKNFELDKDTENTLLEILSDPNPDPEMRQGEPCNNGTRCAYCNNIIDGEIYTYQNFLKEYNTQLLLIGEWTSVGFGGSLIKEAMIRLCSEYKNGERYECKLHSVKDGANDFCSEKCKTEYSFSH